MAGEGYIPALMFMTLIAAFIFGVWQLAVFLRSRRNRKIMENVVKD